MAKLNKKPIKNNLVDGDLFVVLDSEHLVPETGGDHSLRTINFATLSNLFSGPGVDTNYVNMNPTPYDVGGIPSGSNFPNGTTMTDVFNRLFYPYVSPSFLNIEMGSIIFEIGDNTHIGDISWNTINNTSPTKIMTDSISMVDSNSTIIFENMNNNSTNQGAYKCVPDLEYTKVDSDISGGEAVETFTISATNTNSEVFNFNHNIYWRYAIYYGESTRADIGESPTTEKYIDGEDIGGSATPLRVKNLSNGPTGDYVFDTGGYKYICYPAFMGEPSSFIDISTGLNVPFEDVRVLGITNEFGVLKDYNIYRSTNIINSSITIRIAGVL